MACAFLERRDQFCTFDKIQLAIQESCKRNFTRTHLAQIKMVYPEAYNVDCGRNGLLISRNRTATHQEHTSKKTSHWTEAEMMDRKREFKQRLLQRVQAIHAVRRQRD